MGLTALGLKILAFDSSFSKIKIIIFKMFKKFDYTECVSSINNMKSSAQRNIKTELVKEMPFIEDYVDEILPKKEGLRLVKCSEHIEMVAGKSGEILFFKQRDVPWYPTLRLLHKYPFILPKMQVDKGAIRFILSGANIMCPGLTSAGAKMTESPEKTMVAVTAEGKEHAIAIGVTKMSTTKILEVNKGIGIENIHYLNDGLWHMKPISG